jgi:hypothetical protein
VEFFDFDGVESARLTAAGLDEPPPDHPAPEAPPADEAVSPADAGSGT